MSKSDNISININILEKLVVEFFQKSCKEIVYNWQYSIKPIWQTWEKGEWFLWDRSIFKISFKNKKMSFSPEESITNSKEFFKRLQTTNFN